MGGFGSGVPLNAERKKREKDEAIAKAKLEGKDLLKIEQNDKLMKVDGTPGEYFFTACRKGELEELKELYSSVSSEVFNVNGTDFWKRSMLHIACREGMKNIVKYLLFELKASTSVIDKVF